jgi:cyclase
MLKKRLIPVLYLQNGLIVRSELFTQFKIIGDPIQQLERLSEWQADELVYVDITRPGGTNEQLRSDLKYKFDDNLIGILREIAKFARMPLTFGGGIQSLQQADALIANGADKVLINSAAYKNPDLITQVANKYGSQAMMVGLDVKRENGKFSLYIDQGRTRTDKDILDWAREAISKGAGEILVNSIDRDGCAEGFDPEVHEQIAKVVSVPVIACGGAGAFEHFAEPLKGHVSAAAAGNIFHFTELAYRRAKKYLKSKGINVR